jgi:hypothetical protein
MITSVLLCSFQASFYGAGLALIKYMSGSVLEIASEEIPE